MSDRAGSLIGFRVNAGPVIIKVTRYGYNPEIKHNRAVKSDSNQNPRTVLTSIGGILSGTGFVDPSDAGIALLLVGMAGAIGNNQVFTSVEFLLDVSETAASRHGMSMGTCELLPLEITGQTDEGGMTEVNFEIHSQAGVTYSSSLT